MGANDDTAAAWHPYGTAEEAAQAERLERAARAMYAVKSYAHDETWDETHPNVQEHYLNLARAALAAADGPAS